MTAISQIYVLLFSCVMLNTRSQTLDICSSGDCNWNNPSTSTILVCTNTANSCTVSMGSATKGWSFDGGKLYSAAPTTLIDCNGDSGCRYGEFHCGNEVPPNAASYNLTESNFSGTVSCHFDCSHLHANVCSDTKFHCSGDVSSCSATSSIGVSLDRSTMYCTGITNPNTICTMDCSCCTACDYAVMDCSNTLASCQSTGSASGRVDVQTSKPTISPTIPTIYPTSSPSIPTLYPTLYPTINPTINPTGRPTISPSKIPTINPTLYPTVRPTISPSKIPTVYTVILATEYTEEYEVSFDTDDTLTEEEINSKILVAVQSTYPNAEIISTQIENKSVVVTLSITSDTELDSEIVKETIKTELDEMDDINNVVVNEINKPKAKKKNNSSAIVLGVIGGIVLVLIIVFGVCIWYRYRVSNASDEEKQIEMEMEMQHPMHVNNVAIQNVQEDDNDDEEIVQSVNSFGQTEGNTYSNDTNLLQGEFVIGGTGDDKLGYDTRGATDSIDNVDTIIDTGDDDTQETEQDNLEKETMVADNSDENNTMSDEVVIGDIDTLQ